MELQNAGEKLEVIFLEIIQVDTPKLLPAGIAQKVNLGIILSNQGQLVSGHTSVLHGYPPLFRNQNRQSIRFFPVASSVGGWGPSPAPFPYALEAAW
jgi:hypothetical protein